jgi:hypothetical protein
LARRGDNPDSDFLERGTFLGEENVETDETGGSDAGADDLGEFSRWGEVLEQRGAQLRKMVGALTLTGVIEQ